MLLHQLKLNNEKTEFIVLQSPHNLRVYGSPSLELPGLTLTSTDAVRNLGCYFDRHMQLDRLVSSYCSSAYYHLRLISRIRHLLTRRVPCRNTLSCAESPRLLQWSTRWTEQWTDKPTPTSTKLCRSRYQLCQTARSRHRFCDRCIGCRSR